MASSQRVRHIPASVVECERKSTVGFCALGVGGTGGNAFHQFERIAERNDTPFPYVNVLLDTDASSFANNPGDDAIYLQMNERIIRVLKGNSGLFSPSVGRVLLKEAHMLGSGDIRNGMRTTRCLTQLAFTYHESMIRSRLLAAIKSLIKQGATHVIFVISGSTGGGTGSAAAVLLLQALSRRSFVSKMMIGLSPSMLLPSLVFAVEPFSFAQQKEGMQQKKIIANAYAYRLETDELIRRGAPVQYIFHIGYHNESGTCLDTSDQIGQVLGNSLYAVQRNYAELKRDWVDGPDDAAVNPASTCRGVDFKVNRDLDRRWQRDVLSLQCKR